MFYSCIASWRITQFILLYSYSVFHTEVKLASGAIFEAKRYNLWRAVFCFLFCYSLVFVV